MADMAVKNNNGASNSEASNSEFIANLLIRIAIWEVLNLIRRAAHDGYWVPT